MEIEYSFVRIVEDGYAYILFDDGLICNPRAVPHFTQAVADADVHSLQND